MTTKKTAVKNERPWPDDWTVYFEWEFVKSGKTTIIGSRQYDVRVGGTWFMFDRYVINGKGSEWLDVFWQHPYAGWHAVRPEDVTQVRQHVDKKPKGRS